ncbi:MAG: TIR domain-containing protein [Firmicutes bacterium]|nr:TIR domain-containing protein [Bacillota bacterium]
MRLQAYEGQEPFVFVSYAHKDTDKVMGVLTELDRRGYRIWYDDGIVPGSEWPENIAEHLTDSAMVLAFISQNSIDSPNCRREITFALSKRKPFLSVVLERTEMSPGMELQLSAQQSVIRNNYEDEAGFINKICSCPDLKPCLNPASEPLNESAPKPEIQAILEPQAASVQETEPKQEPIPKPEPKPASVSQAAPLPILKQKNKPVKKSKTPQADGKGKKKSGLRIGLIIAGVLLIAFIIKIIVMMNPPKTPQIVISDTVSVSETTYTVKLTEETITKDTVSNLQRLENLTTLTLEKCTFEDGALYKLTELPLTTLGFTDMSGIADYSFLNDFTKLKEIALVRCGVTDQNFTLASNEGITAVNLTGNQAFTDLKLLNTAVLKTLNIDGTGVVNLSSLAEADNLNYLYASDTKVTDISPLADLTELRTLALNRTGIKTIDKVFQSLRLQTLQFADCGITSMSGFENLTVLTEVDLSGNQLTDISWLYKSAESLKEVHLAGNPLTDRLQQLSECKQIQILDISGIPVYTMYCAKDAAELTELYAENCQITSIEELADKAKLKIVDLSDNKITDYSAISQIDYSMGIIDLSNNEITSLSPVAKTRILNLIGNPVSYASVPESFTVQYLYCEYNTDLPDSGLADRVSVRLGVLNVPADKQVALEKISGRIRIMTADEVQEAIK